MPEMSSVEKEILEEVEFLKERYFTYDDPVPFCGLKIYPVKMKNYNEFMVSNKCLLLNKNDDPKGIKMSTVDYLLSKVQDEKDGPMWASRLTKIVELCFHVEPGMKCDKCGKHIDFSTFVEKAKSAKTDDELNAAKLCDVDGCGGMFVPSISTGVGEDGRNMLVIDGHNITNKDFMRFRRYVLYQNLPDYKDDSWVNKDVRDDQARKNEILSRGSGEASLERKMLCLSLNSQYKVDEIAELSMRKFLMMFSIMNDEIEYKIAKLGLMSGMVKLENGAKLDHWIYKKDEGLYGEGVSLDKTKQKFGQ